MLYLLLHYLTASISLKMPAAFFYTSTRMLLAALTAFLITLLLGPSCTRLLYRLKTGQSIRVEACPTLAQLHQKKKQTPTMGGVLILLSMLLALLLWMDLSHTFTLALGVATVWLGIIGGVDDYLKMKRKSSSGLSARTKFIWQCLFASLIGFYLLSPALQQGLQSGRLFSPPFLFMGGEEMHYGSYLFPFKKGIVWSLSGGVLIIAFLITLTVIVGASNAVNLTDGLDGLATGCTLLVAAVFASVAFLSNNYKLATYLNIPYIDGAGEIGIYLCAMAGGCLGFLWYNGYPAQLFMGDVGSLPLGGILGTAAVLMRREFLLALVGGVFVIEALSVILQVLSYRYRNKKRLFRCAPLHHHFETIKKNK